MRIAFISDVHFGERKAEKMAIFEYILNRDDIDAFLSGGDWDFIPYTLDELDVLLTGRPLVSIYGNHDDPNVLKYYGILLGDGEIIDLDDVRVCGLGGAVVEDPYTYPETWHDPDYYLQKYFEIKDRLRKDLKKCDILLTHDAPKALVDAEIRADWRVANYIDVKSERIVFDTIAHLLKPRVYFCGHIHSIPYMSKLVKSRSVYNGGREIAFVKVLTSKGAYAIVDTDEWVVEVWDMDELVEKLAI